MKTVLEEADDDGLNESSVWQDGLWVVIRLPLGWGTFVHPQLFGIYWIDLRHWSVTVWIAEFLSSAMLRNVALCSEVQCVQFAVLC